MVIDDLFDGNSYEASISEQDGEGVVLIEFVLGNGRMFGSELEHQVV